MKNNFLVVLISICFFGFSQKNKNIDTNKICIPYYVCQKILIDLNDYDKIKKTIPTYENEILQLNKKIEFLDKEILTWKKEDELNQEIIKEKNNSIIIYKEENKNLAKENKRLKTKNTLFNIISGIVIAPLTYIAIFK